MRTRVWLRRCLGTTVATILVSSGLMAVTSVNAGAQNVDDAEVSAEKRRHTDDIDLDVVCNTKTWEYVVTATMTTSNVPSNVTGSTMWRTGDSSFDGTPTDASGMDKGPVSTRGNETVELGTWPLPGTTTGLGPWVYAYTTWSNGNTKGSDGQLREEQKLEGDCRPSTTNDCPDLPGDQPPGAQCEPKSQTQVRDIETGPNCKMGASLSKHQERSRTEKYVNGAFVWGKWSKWKTVSSTSSANPPGVCEAKVRAHCVTKHWGEGVATLFNKGARMPQQFRIVRTGADRVVTVRGGHNRTVNLTGLRVGSVVKVRADGKTLDRDKVEGGCGKTPPPHTGERTAGG